MLESVDDVTRKEIDMLREIQDRDLLVGNTPFDIEITDIVDVTPELRYWGFKRYRLKKQIEKGYRLIQFGQGGDGSMYCFWDYPGRTERMPVVIFGSEGGAFVHSNNLTDMCLLLNSYQDLDFHEWVINRKEADMRREYPDYDFASLHGITHPIIGSGRVLAEDVRKNAQISHPSFEEWVAANTGGLLW